jgi:probable HAF family extracellular repeat protein
MVHPRMRSVVNSLILFRWTGRSAVMAIGFAASMLLVANALPSFTPTDIAGGNYYALPDFVTDNGIVVGQRINDAGQDWRAFVWTKNTGRLDLWLGAADPTFDFSYVAQVSKTGTIAGYSSMPDYTYRGFVWTPTAGLVLLTLGDPYSYAAAVNASDWVIGQSHNGANRNHAFVWDPATGIHDLGTLGGGESSAAAINDAGMVVGSSRTPDNLPHAFVWTAQSGLINIDTLNSTYSYAFLVNDAGMVAGYRRTGAGENHAFVWTSGDGMVDVGTLGGPHSFPNQLTNSGWLTGQSYTSDGFYRGFAWNKTRGIIDLNLAGRDSGVTRINENGTATGYSYVTSDSYHGFVWTPTGGILDVTPTAERGYPSLLNENDVVAGYTYSLATGALPAFAWTPTTGTVSLTLGGFVSSSPVQLSQTDVVIGQLYNASDSHAFRWTPSTGMIDLGTFGGPSSYVLDLNDAGDVLVGYAGHAGSGATAFVWTLTDGMTDLGTLTGGTFSVASAVNNFNLIVGQSTTSGDVETHAVVWSAASDTIAPTAAPIQTPTANGAGWNTGAVTVAWHWSDDADGVGIDPNNCTTSSVSSGSGVLNVSANCKDLAGNEGSANRTVKVDPLAPTIQIVSPTATSYVLNAAATVSYSCLDQVGLSGVATCAGPIANGGTLNTGSVGSKVFTVSATDVAGNTAAQTVTYNVRYNFTGFLQPVDNLPTANTTKAGSTIPVKFRLGGNQGLAVVAAGFPGSVPIACESGSALDEIEQTVTTNASALTYDATTDTYSYLWKTDKAWAGSCRQLNVRLADGTNHEAKFQFR